MRLTSPSLTIAACAVIQDAHGRVLLAHHTYRQQPWDLPGGLLGRLEQPMAALQRELQEELDGGAVVGPLLHARVHEQTRHLTLYFRADMSSLPHCSSHEVDGYRFVAPEEIAALLGASPSWLHLVSPAPTSNTPPVV